MHSIALPVLDETHAALSACLEVWVKRDQEVLRPWRGPVKRFGYTLGDKVVWTRHRTCDVV